MHSLKHPFLKVLSTCKTEPADVLLQWFVTAEGQNREALLGAVTLASCW